MIFFLFRKKSSFAGDSGGMVALLDSSGGALAERVSGIARSSKRLALLRNTLLGRPIPFL
jgi:hypothetical protein